MKAEHIPSAVVFAHRRDKARLAAAQQRAAMQGKKMESFLSFLNRKYGGMNEAMTKSDVLTACALDNLLAAIRSRSKSPLPPPLLK